MGGIMTPAEVQEKVFGILNREGSFALSGDFPLGVVDDWRVLRVSPHAGSDGYDFWVCWRRAGFLGSPGDYDGLMHFVHVTRFTAWRIENETLILTDYHSDEPINVEFATDAQLAEWEEQQADKRDRAAEYKAYYEASLPEIQGLANSL